MSRQYLHTVSVSDYEIRNPYSSFKSNNKITIYNIEHLNDLTYRIYFQIVSMDSLQSSLYSNDQLAVVASYYSQNSRSSYHCHKIISGKNAGKSSRNTDPRTWHVNSYKQLTSRIDYIDVNCNQRIEMSERCFDKFLNNNYTYYELKFRLELCLTDYWNSGGLGQNISPKFKTESNVIVFKCEYEY